MAAKYDEDTTIDDIMRQWPATIRVILNHGMLCVGCPIASFHCVEDAVRQHEIDGDKFRSDLEAAIKSSR